MRRPGGFDDPAEHERERSDRGRASGRAAEPKPPADEPVSLAPIIRFTPIAESAAPESAAPELPERESAEPESAGEATFRESEHPTGDDASVEKHEGRLDGVRRAREYLKQAERERRGRERREQRRFTEHVRARRRRWLVGGAAILALALFVVIGVFTPVMAVREIQLEGAQSVNPEELRQALGRLEGTPLALVSDQDVHRALEPFPLIQRYAVERIPPHTLIVRIEERTPVIAMQREDEFELLDAAGVLLGRVAERPAGVPLGSPELTDTSSAAFQAAATVVRDMPADMREHLVAVRASSAQDVSFELAGGTEVIWGEAVETQKKAAVLRSMIASIGAPSMIDVSVPDTPVFK